MSNSPQQKRIKTSEADASQDEASDPLPVLPDDIIALLAENLAGLKLIFRLALTSTHNLAFVPSKIVSFEEPWIEKQVGTTAAAARGAGRATNWWRILPKLRAVSSVTVSVPSPGHWAAFRDQLFSRHADLKVLNLISESPTASASIQADLRNQTGEISPLSKLERLAMDLHGMSPSCLVLFPNVKQLVATGLSFQEPVDLPVTPNISQICPNLTSLLLPNSRFTSQKLEELKGLKNLETLAVDFDLKGDPLLSEVYHLFWLNQSKENAVRALDCYYDYMERFSPIGLRLRVCQIGLNFVAVAMMFPEFPIFPELATFYRKAGLAHIPGEQIFSNRELFACFAGRPDAQLEMLKLAIESGVDLGALIDMHFVGGDKIRSRLEYIVETVVCSVEMFKLIFETKLAQNGMMTAFEYAKSLHPEYPFFWRLPVFMASVLPKVSPPDDPVELPKYLLHNRDRLIPLCGSEAVFGGPFALDIYGIAPLHRCERVEQLQLLAELGADPWELDAQGDTILTQPNIELTNVCIHYLVNLPTFDPKFVYRSGRSLLDEALSAHTIIDELVLALVEKGAITTGYTANLLIGAMSNSPSQGRALFHVLPLLPPDQIMRVLHDWIALFCPPELHAELAEFILNNLVSKVDIPIMELSMPKYATWTLLHYCAACETSAALDSLVKLVRASPHSAEIIDSWQLNIDYAIRRTINDEVRQKVEALRSAAGHQVSPAK